MLKVAVYNQEGKQVKDTELNELVFGIEPNNQAIFDMVLLQRASWRQGTHKVKNRTEVRGGGRKPWRQKGTGRARQGSIRSPQWTGGGVVFAPKPRDYSFKMNRTEKLLALKSALTTRVNESKFIVLDELTLAEAKTKAMVNVLNALNLNKALIVTEDKVSEGRATDNSKNVMLAARNIQNVKTANVNNINVYDILKYDTVVVTKEALAKIEEVYA